MWFLRGRPTSISIQDTIKSVGRGYQSNVYIFKFDAVPESLKDGKAWIGIPHPWAPHKVNGGVTIINESSDSSACVIPESEIQFHIKPRDLKKSNDIELAFVQEMCSWYLDDIGVMTMWVEPGKLYSLQYTHKISSDSCLFAPTRMSSFFKIKSSNLPDGTLDLNYILHVYGALAGETPKHLCKTEDVNGGNTYSFKDWRWDTDTHFHTDNWESSDDASDSSEAEAQTDA